MERGYYVVYVLGTPCRHRHYELSRALKRCSAVVGASVWYVDARNSLRRARPDELAELATK